MIVEIQCLPSPKGTAEHRFAHVAAAIRVIQDSGLHHEVGPLGTSLEGEPDEVWPLLRLIHEATLEAGADSVVTVVKVAEQRVDPVTIDDLVGDYR